MQFGLILSLRDTMANLQRNLSFDVFGIAKYSAIKQKINTQNTLNLTRISKKNANFPTSFCWKPFNALIFLVGLQI